MVGPGSLARWLDGAWVERVVFDGPDRIGNVGVRRRSFTGATRRVVEVRDRECFHELCDISAEQCQVDHLLPYAAGGLTTEDKGRLACGYHAQPQSPPTKAAAAGTAAVTPTRCPAQTTRCSPA